MSVAESPRRGGLGIEAGQAWLLKDDGYLEVLHGRAGRKNYITFMVNVEA